MQDASENVKVLMGYRRWAEENREDLERDYSGRFVAIHNNHVIYSDTDRERVEIHIFRTLKIDRPIYITMVPLEPIREDLIPTIFDE